ncbi:site-specific integrase [Klebsiella oxytoca]|uniref:tyrosine-type recombinase/integrase n=1 Tax=Klebsiella oxytoca TaxID=571 RepID=UPI00189F127B|nr:site-specific integrase [Klebsiella oxytoca]ELT9694395.1 site-specific integrase [Klebsiella oxytoca]HDH0729670.1 site-specific integrase [Klebsiella oxytoca]
MLTDAKLRKMNGKPIPKRIELSDANGLSVRVTPNGVIVFQYRYKIDGRPRRMTIGQYDQVSLKEAREQVSEFRKLVAVGKDPITARDMAVEANIKAATVEDCIKAWLGSASASRLVKRDQWERALYRHVVPYVGSMLVDEMAISHWQPVFKRMRDNDAETYAGEVLSRMKTIFSYCIRIELIKRNPVTDLRVIDVGKPAKKGKRNLSDKEIGALWHAVEASTITHQNKLLLKLLLLTGCRGVELRLAKKADFDLDARVWRVPDEHSKTREPFERGLSLKAVEILREAFSLYEDFSQVFPPAAKKEDRPMAASVILNLAIQLREDMTIDHWSIHDLRRTAKTKMAELGVMPHVSEKVLGHKLSGVLAIYDQHSYLREQQEALDLLAAHIQSCVDSTSP